VIADCIVRQIHRAAQYPVELDQAQADAVEARILLDLKIGAAFTRMQTLSLQTKFHVLGDKLVSYGAWLRLQYHGPLPTVSQGPCQFPTLGFVVQRYNQVKNFVPESFWYIHLSHVRQTTTGPQETIFNWQRGHLFDVGAAVALYSHVLESPGSIKAKILKVNNKDTKKW